MPVTKTVLYRREIRQTSKVTIFGIPITEQTTITTIEVQQTVPSVTYPKVPTVISLLAVCLLTAITFGWTFLTWGVFESIRGDWPTCLFVAGIEVFLVWFLNSCWKHVRSEIRSRLPMKNLYPPTLPKRPTPKRRGIRFLQR